MPPSRQPPLRRQPNRKPQPRKLPIRRRKLLLAEQQRPWSAWPRQPAMGQELRMCRAARGETHRQGSPCLPLPHPQDPRSNRRKPRPTRPRPIRRSRECAGRGAPLRQSSLHPLSTPDTSRYLLMRQRGINDRQSLADSRLTRRPRHASLEASHLTGRPLGHAFQAASRPTGPRGVRSRLRSSSTPKQDLSLLPPLPAPRRRRSILGRPSATSSSPTPMGFPSAAHLCRSVRPMPTRSSLVPTDCRLAR